MTLSPDEMERLAQKRAGAKLGWYVHAMVYVVVNLFILAISRYGFGERPWSALPLLAWGLGLALHGFSVFVLGSGVHDPLVQHERERQHRHRERR